MIAPAPSPGTPGEGCGEGSCVRSKIVGPRSSIVKDGELEATVEGRAFVVPTGSMLLIAPNELHGRRNAGQTPATPGL